MPEVLAATTLVAVCPVLAVWELRAIGVVASPAAGMAIGIALSLAAAQLAAAYWRTRPGSRVLLFSELLAWGFVHRCYLEWRLRRARSLLGPMSSAQARQPHGLSRAGQTRQLERLAREMDARDPGTHGHSRRVARHAWMIATRMGLPREQVARIRTAAAIHDIGKTNTPLAILLKPGPLTDAEYDVVKRHTTDGAQMAAALNDLELAELIRCHHERLDGSGYPGGLAGEEIPLGARIIAVADTFDSITQTRAYKAARSHSEALRILKEEAPQKLDAAAVRAFYGHYSGRRPLTLWASLASLPERAIEQFTTSVAGGVATAAKLAAVAVIVGAAAGSSAVTLQPARHDPPRTTAAVGDTPATPPARERVAFAGMAPRIALSALASARAHRPLVEHAWPAQPRPGDTVAVTPATFSPSQGASRDAAVQSASVGEGAQPTPSNAANAPSPAVPTEHGSPGEHELHAPATPPEAREHQEAGKERQDAGKEHREAAKEHQEAANGPQEAAKEHQEPANERKQAVHEAPSRPSEPVEAPASEAPVHKREAKAETAGPRER